MAAEGVPGIEALGGFFIGNLAAILLATVFIHSKAIQEAFFPIAVMINTIPVVAKAPILVLLGSLGKTSTTELGTFGKLLLPTSTFGKRMLPLSFCGQF